MIDAVASAGYGWRPSAATSATLIGWYEVRSDLVTLVGSNCSVIANRVAGGANPLVQADDLSRGVYSATSWGSSRPAVTFDGATDCMTANGLAASVTGTDMPFTVQLLCEPLTLGSVVGTIRSLFGFGSSADDQPLHDLRLPDSTSGVMSSGRRDSAAFSRIKDAATAITTTRTMLSLTFSGTKAKLRVNGALDSNLDGASVSADNDVGALTGLDRFTVGALTRTITSGNVNMRLAGMVVYAGALSDAELAKNERYLEIGHPL
jgi:hypothetical protein